MRIRVKCVWASISEGADPDEIELTIEEGEYELQQFYRICQDALYHNIKIEVYVEPGIYVAIAPLKWSIQGSHGEVRGWLDSWEDQYWTLIVTEFNYNVGTR